MEQISSLEAKSRSATQEFPKILWNPKVHYRVQMTCPLVSILSQSIQYQTLNPFPLKSILILSRLHLRLRSGLLPSGFLTNILYAFLFAPFVLHPLPISFS
jgi:hypothetical protein